MAIRVKNIRYIDRYIADISDNDNVRHDIVIDNRLREKLIKN